MYVIKAMTFSPFSRKTFVQTIVIGNGGPPLNAYLPSQRIGKKLDEVQEYILVRNIPHQEI